ncbi:DUF262 domain-containing protein [Leptothoe sp. PORK10 BA2]|uniref:DUF262 domain-containing protein n=1 Tax=Leptothoe sp. PORK10 BA2 TaxID=3110254 RepID=UPI002B21198B|nr:DUF262 domain-containing protein [Leptothoe sp. PORK10 BA2]MEA5467180.1 DUF262 domain-containing protein [Leptothoe sp. PORK10 BA2]
MPKAPNVPIETEITAERRDEAEAEIRDKQKPIDYDTKEYPVEILVQKYTDGLADDTNELFIPDYQREMAWDDARQSKFIESVLLGLPIPYVFVADIPDEENEARLEIIDGTQRIRTLARFLNNELKLEDLEKLKKLNDFRFSDLPLPRQRRFKRTTLRMIQLTEKATEDIRRDMFERINTGSVVLNEMEKRRGIQRGPFLEFIDQLSENTKFRGSKDPEILGLCSFSDALVDRREPQEFVLRFFAYLNNYKNFKRQVNEFLNEYLETNNNGDFDREAMQAEFEAMLDFVEKYFPNGFRKGKKHTTTPRIRFEAIAVGTALALREKSDLAPGSMAWLDSPEFKEHTTSDASNSKPKVKNRIEYVRDQLLGRL